MANFSEDGGMARASGAGQVVGVLLKGFVGEDGEGEGFFGVGWNAKSAGGDVFQRGQKRGEVGDQQRIAGAAPGENEFSDAGVRKNEILDGLGDGGGGKCGCRVK